MNKFSITTACKILNEGGVIAYPTEAVFGLGCDPANPKAINKLLAIKARSETKGLILVAANFEHLSPFIKDLPPELFYKVMKSWPGPVNWLLPANPAAPKYLRGKHKLQAVRISNHPVVQALCNKFGGALISTSANLSNRPPAKNAIQTRLRFSNKIDFIIHEITGNLHNPCEIRNGLTNEVIRSSN